MIDKYFKYPLVYDYLLAASLCSFFFYLHYKGYLGLPEKDILTSTATDLSTIALTIAGFILTLLTVLITFKTGAKIPNEGVNENIPVFDLFFSTSLYYQTTDLLKNAIKSLVFVAVVGFSLKLLLPPLHIRFLFYSNILGLIVILMTLWRSLLILSKIVNLQREH